MIIASLYHCPLDYAQIAHDMSCAIITKNKIYAYEEEKLTSLKNESTVHHIPRINSKYFEDTSP